jgi:hypothetical protein
LLDYIYLGPDKTGSTWLFKALQSHKDIHVAICKDLYFFDRYYHRGLKWYMSKLNEGHTSEKIKGEISHDYLFSKAASVRIQTMAPNAKLITFLRDPIERSFSQYLYIKKSGLTKKPLLEAINEFPEIIDNSLYDIHLVKYQWARKKGNLKIFLFEDLLNSEKNFASKVIGSLLGVESNTNIDLPGKQRAASTARFYLLAKIMKKSALIARDHGLEDLIGKIKHSNYMNFLYKNYDVKPTPTKQEISFLMECFSESMKNLKEDYNIDTNKWLAKYE